MSTTVLVGVDEHPTARDAVVLGAALASATHDELVVAHVYPLDPMADSVAFGAPAMNPLRAEAEQIVADAIADIASDARPVVAAAHSPARGLHLLAGEEHAELIVVGSSHRNPIGRSALGTHSTRVVHGAPCAVAVAPLGLAQHGFHLNTIAVAVDGSDEANDALTFARRLAGMTNASLRLVAALPPQLAEWGRYRYVPDEAGYAERAREAAERVLSIARSGEQTEIREGRPAAALLEVTREVDLLVMGSRSYGPAKRLLLGSVSDPVVRRSGCPVIVMPRSARTEDTPVAAATDAATT